MASFGDGYRWYCSGLIHDETGFPVSDNPQLASDSIKRLVGKVENNLKDIESYEEYKTEDAEYLIVSIGLLSRSVKDAVDQARQEGIKVGVFRPITVWPFPEQRLAELSQNKRKLFVCEMNEGQLYHVVRESAGVTPVVQITQNNGKMIAAETILKALKEEI